MSSITYIYGLVDPRNEEVRYIGKSVNPSKRLICHIHEAKSKRDYNPHKCNWIRNLLAEGLKPQIKIFVIVPPDKSWEVMEKWMINYGYERGWKLTNMIDGGAGAMGSLGEIHKKKISEAIKRKNLERKPHWGKVIKEEHLALLGTMPDNHLASMAKVSPETIRQHRLKRSIPASVGKRNPKKSSFPAEAYIHLGIMPDYEIAEKYNVSKKIVSCARKRKNIPHPPLRADFTWNEASIKCLGTMPDLDVSRKFHVEKEVVIQKRMSLGISLKGCHRPKK